MNVFIYDDFLNDKKYINELSRIEGRLTDLGLNGKISRMGPLKNITGAIRDELRRGAKTITAVGNDLTFNKALDALLNTGIPLGIIPIGEKNNSIASALGIGDFNAACEILSARRTEIIDVGYVDSNKFISSTKIDFKKIHLKISQGFSINIERPGSLYIVNLQTPQAGMLDHFLTDPRDGKLHLFIKLGSKSKSFFRGKQSNSIFKIKNAEFIIDGEFKARVGVYEKALKIIVGKKRTF